MENNQTFPSSIETIIRPFERSDLDSIENIERRSFNDPWSRSEFKSFHQRDGIRFLVAVRNAKVIGYVIVDVMKTMDPLKLRLIKRGHLLNIAVDPKHRRYSVGKTLVDSSIRYLRKESAQEIWLEVRGSNSIAKRFYLKMGFKETGRKNRYYLTEDALVMKKKL